MTNEPNVTGLPVREIEKYVTRQELAEIMGVSVRTVDDWLAKGMTHERWGRRLVRFQPSQAMQWVRTQGEAR